MLVMGCGEAATPSEVAVEPVMVATPDCVISQSQVDVVMAAYDDVYVDLASGEMSAEGVTARFRDTLAAPFFVQDNDVVSVTPSGSSTHHALTVFVRGECTAELDALAGQSAQDGQLSRIEMNIVKTDRGRIVVDHTARYR